MNLVLPNALLYSFDKLLELQRFILVFVTD